MKVKVWTEVVSVIGDDGSLQDKTFGCWRAEDGSVQYGIDPMSGLYREIAAIEAAILSANRRYEENCHVVR